MSEARFWAKVEQTDTCWLWTAATRSGYGKFNAGGRVYVTAHRWSYEQLHGAVPVGLVLDHLCRVKNCVRPSHLEAVTQAENLARSIRPAKYTPEATCRSGRHQYAATGWYTKPSTGERECLPCRIERKAKAA